MLPYIDPDTDIITAGRIYTNAGLYLLPIVADTKDPGSIAGTGWPVQSTCAPDELAGWIANTDADGIALHAGRSGLVIFDVDNPDNVPDELWAAFDQCQAPYQATRTDVPGKGHYVFRQPAGRRIGNGLGKLPTGWGEIRGENGVIVLSPTGHNAENGRYEWLHTGDIPELPAEIADLLRDADPASQDLTDPELREGYERLATEDHDGQRGIEVEKLTAQALRDIDEHTKSWHETCNKVQLNLLRRGEQGDPGVQSALAEIEKEFVEAARADPKRRGDPAAEWRRGLKGAVHKVVRAGRAVPATLPDDFGKTDLPLTEEQGEAPVPASAEETGERTPTATLFEQEVAVKVREGRVRREAERQLKQQDRGELAPVVPLGDFLAVEDADVQYRIDRLLPVGGRAILSAPYKSGKSTLIANLLRSLADGDPFLGGFEPEQPDGRIVLFDDELDERMLRRWLREQGITNTERIQVVSLRGRVSSFDVLDERTRSEWAAALKAADASLVVLDCLRPVLDSLGLSEDKDAGRFLVHFDELLAESGVAEAIVVHHAGHSGERSRGDSRLRDWPDVEWRLVRERADDEEVCSPDARRYFSAFGRDVDVPEGLLTFDSTARRLTLAGGSRKETRADTAIPDLMELLDASPNGISSRQIEFALNHPQKVVREAVKRVVQTGAARVEKGPRNAHLYFSSSVRQSSSPVRQRGQSEFVSSSKGDELNSEVEPTTSATPKFDELDDRRGRSHTTSGLPSEQPF